MRAVVVREFGPPSALVTEDVPDPRPGEGEVVIAVELSSITFVETQVRAGRPPNPAMAPALPAVLGNGVGGVVDGIGPGVDPALAGRRVITTTGGSGGYAERVAVPAAGVIDVSDGPPLPDAVALLADGRTAVGLIRGAAPRPGETVLVEAAAGGVGTLLVQLARAAGADVIALAGSPEKLELARRLGAGLALDYTDPAWPDRFRTERGGVDVVFDGVGGAVGAAALALARRGGRFCPFGLASGSFTSVDPAEAEARGITVVRGARPTPEAMRELTLAALTEAVAGRLHPVVGQSFPLDRAADAHAAIEARATTGKTLLTVGDPGGLPVAHPSV
jgi:NADPH:quinone reductase